MAFLAGAIIIGAAASIGSAGIAAATRPGSPDAPDYGRATREGIEADIDTLGRRKEIEAAARMGGEILLDGYTSKQVSTGDEGIAAEIARLEGQITDAQKRMDAAESGIDRGTAFGANGRPLSPFNDSQKRFDEARAEYESLNSTLLGLNNSLEQGGDITLYYDSDGNQVDRSTALDTDFTGISDIDQSVAAARAQLDFMDEAAQAQLDIQQKYGSEFIQSQLDMLQESDPIGFQMREEMGRAILSEGFGTNLTDAQTQEVQQATRAGQAARGNIFGAAPAAVEAMQTGDAGFRLRQQRLANAAAFMQGETPQAQFGQISNAQQGAAPVGSFNMMTGIGPNPNAGAQGAAFAQGNYNTQSQNWATGLSNDPWQSLLGSVTQMGVQGASNALFGGGGVSGPGGQTFVPAQGSGGTFYRPLGGF